MRTLISRSLLALCAVPLMAGGEYDHLHIGPTLGVGWSPTKQYAGFNSEVDGKRQVAAMGGVVFRYAPWLKPIEGGLDVEILRPLKTGKGKDGAEDVEQTIFRATGRLIFHFKNISDSGGYWWIGPTLSRAQTTYKETTPANLQITTKVTQNLAGAALGIGTRTHRETSSTFWEANVFYTSEGSNGLRAGGTSIEFKTGIVW